jgi:hypothetical protein
MQAIERQYLEFVKRFGPQLEGAVTRYRDEAAAFGEDPESVCLSRQGALHFLGVRSVDETFFATSRFAEQLQAWAAYRRHKHVYVIDDVLAEALVEATWPEELDVSSLFLPVPGAAISVRLPGSTSKGHFIGLYDLQPAPGGYERELRFVQVHEDGSVTPCGCLLLRPRRLEETLRKEEQDVRKFIENRRISKGLDAVGVELQRGVQHLGDVMRTRGRVLRQLLNVLLYIHGNQDVVARVHPGRRPSKADARGRTKRRAEARSPITVLDVGEAYASTLRRWEMEQHARDLEDDRLDHGRHVRPHLRRAHLHLYWTGEGRSVPTFRLVKPTLVHGGGSPNTVTVQGVR